MVRAGALLLCACFVCADAHAVDEEESDAEIIVEGRMELERARMAVDGDLRDRGYIPKKRKGNYVLYRHPETWKGEIRMYDDGWLRVKRQPVQFRVPELRGLPKNSPVAGLLCVVAPTACIKTGGQVVSKSKFMAQKVRTLDGMEGNIAGLGDAVANYHTDLTANQLPEKLTALWTKGVPLDKEGEALGTIPARKQALLAYWESRSENRWGMRIRAVVETFIREEVQYSPHPYTDAEIETFNEKRTCFTALDLVRPWEDVERDMEMSKTPPGSE